MTTSQFLKIKLTAKQPEFKQLVGLKASNETSKLLDFITLLHPNQAKTAQGSKAEVFGNEHYIFTIYTTGILRTEAGNNKRTFYKF